jgi:hypothetical protein
MRAWRGSRAGARRAGGLHLPAHLSPCPSDPAPAPSCTVVARHICEKALLRGPSRSEAMGGGRGGESARRKGAIFTLFHSSPRIPNPQSKVSISLWSAGSKSGPGMKTEGCASCALWLLRLLEALSWLGNLSASFHSWDPAMSSAFCIAPASSRLCCAKSRKLVSSSPWSRTGACSWYLPSGCHPSCSLLSSVPAEKYPLRSHF